MPHYRFHLFEAGEDTVDEEGRDLANLQTARKAAIVGIRDIVGHAMMWGQTPCKGHIDIEDASGAVLDRVDFAEALSLPLTITTLE